MSEDMKFRRWMAKVDAALERLCGMSSGEISDADYVAYFEDEATPGLAARMAMREAGF